MEDLRNRIDCLLSKDRASLSNFEIMVLEDCKDKIEVIEKTAMNTRPIGFRARKFASRL